MKKPSPTAPRAFSWLVAAFCIIATVSALCLAGFIPGRDTPARANAAAEKPDQIYLAYTVNNLGYTATCG